MEISLPSRNEDEEAAEAYEILVGRTDNAMSIVGVVLGAFFVLIAISLLILPIDIT